MTYAVVSAVAMAIAAGVSYAGMQQQARTARKVGEYNAKMNEFAAQDALKQGDKQADEAHRQALLLAGTQRSRMAAAGLDLSEGTAADIQDQTDFFGSKDVATIRDNAQKNAFMSRQAGKTAIWQGNTQAQQSQLSSYGTLLGGAAQVSGRWYDMTHTPTATGG